MAPGVTTKSQEIFFLFSMEVTSEMFYGDVSNSRQRERDAKEEKKKTATGKL